MVSCWLCASKKWCEVRLEYQLSTNKQTKKHPVNDDPNQTLTKNATLPTRDMRLRPTGPALAGPLLHEGGGRSPFLHGRAPAPRKAALTQLRRPLGSPLGVYGSSNQFQPIHLLVQSDCQSYLILSMSMYPSIHVIIYVSDLSLPSYLCNYLTILSAYLAQPARSANVEGHTCQVI